MNTTRLLADLKALGIGVPVRAAYEVSKKTGFHALLYRSSPLASTPPFRSPFQVPVAISRGAQDRTLRAANRILDGQVELFGRTFAVGLSPDWHNLIHEEGRWPIHPWWQIDIRSPNRIGDVKWAWELGRHRHLVLLARASYLDQSARRYLQTLEKYLQSWLDQNLPEMGVHWYSNLEIALRSIAWLQILSLAGDRLDPATVARMHKTLHHSGRHLATDLPHTVSTMRNNHLIGDGLGLVALGLAFPDDKRACRWVRLGDWLLTYQLRRHFRPDGSSIEDSISYDRFVIEMLATRLILGNAPDLVATRLLASGQYLARLGVLEGTVPQFGDWDEGRVIAVAERPQELAGSVRLALSLAGTGAPQQWQEQHDEVAWFAPRGTPAGYPAPVTDGSDVGGGIGRAQSGRWTVWLKAGSGHSHGHADLLSACVLYGDQWVIGDPGTGTYNGPVEQRNYFRSSIAHSVARVDGMDQLEPHRAFRWRYRAHGSIGLPVVDGQMTVVWGVHNAYRRLDPPCRVARVVILRKDQLTVCDWIDAPQHRVTVSLPLAPEIRRENTALKLPDGTRLTLHVSGGLPHAVRGSHTPFDGWWSTTYGSFIPAIRLELQRSSPVFWALSTDPFLTPTTENQVLRLDGIAVRVDFKTDLVQLWVDTETARTVRTL